MLRECQRLVDTWTLKCAEMTTTYWVGLWKGGPFVDDNLHRLSKRLADILSMRDVHHQLSALLSEREVTPRPRGTAARPRGATARPRGTAARPRGTAARPRGNAARPRGAAARPRALIPSTWRCA